MDAIRQALAEVQVSFFGFSYGSELGATWATLFPPTVRAAVLDGAADPDADTFEQTRQQWVGFEAALDTFLDAVQRRCVVSVPQRWRCRVGLRCAARPTRRRSAGGSFRTSRREPQRGGHRRGAGAVLRRASGRSLERSLDDAAAGDGTGLMQLQDAYFQRRADGTYSNLLESFQAITCADDPERPTVEEEDAQAAGATCRSSAYLPVHDRVVQL